MVGKFAAKVMGCCDLPALDSYNLEHARCLVANKVCHGQAAKVYRGNGSHR